MDIPVNMKKGTIHKGVEEPLSDEKFSEYSNGEEDLQRGKKTKRIIFNLFNILC